MCRRARRPRRGQVPLQLAFEDVAWHAATEQEDLGRYVLSFADQAEGDVYRRHVVVAETVSQIVRNREDFVRASRDVGASGHQHVRDSLCRPRAGSLLTIQPLSVSHRRSYQLPFDLSPLKDLDQFALLACQPYNFGNDTDWFDCFRRRDHMPFGFP